MRKELQVLGVVSIFIGAVFIYFILGFIYKNDNHILADVMPYYFAWFLFIYGIYSHIHFEKFTFMKRVPAFVLSIVILFCAYFLKIQNAFDFVIARTILIAFLLTLIPFIIMLSLYFYKKQPR